MNRGDAYKLLAVRLNELRTGGYQMLLSHVGEPPTSDTVYVNGEAVVVDVAVYWADRKRSMLQVWATASGPSTWMMERLDESFVIEPRNRIPG